MSVGSPIAVVKVELAARPRGGLARALRRSALLCRGFFHDGLSQLDPRWRVIARARLTAHRAIHAGGHQPIGQTWRSAASDRSADRRCAASASACSPRTCTSARRDATRAVHRSSPVPPVRRSARGLPAAPAHPCRTRSSGRCRRVSARRCSRRRAHRNIVLQQSLRIVVQPVEPSELVVELRARLRIAVRRVQAADQDAVDRGFDIAALRVTGIAGQARRVTVGSLPRARIAMPFHVFWPTQADA